VALANVSSQDLEAAAKEKKEGNLRKQALAQGLHAAAVPRRRFNPTQ
jgi:hypothetical protein